MLMNLQDCIDKTLRYQNALMCFCSAPASMLVAGKLLWSVGAAGPGMLQRSQVIRTFTEQILEWDCGTTTAVLYCTWSVTLPFIILECLHDKQVGKCLHQVPAASEPMRQR